MPAEGASHCRRRRHAPASDHAHECQAVGAGVEQAIPFYGLEPIGAAGITEVGVGGGDTAPETREAIGDGRALGITPTYLQQGTLLGQAHAVLKRRALLVTTIS